MQNTQKKDYGEVVGGKTQTDVDGLFPCLKSM